MSQFACSEVYVAFLLFRFTVFGQIVNHFAQTGETLIYITQLFKSLSFISLGVFNSFTTGKVNNMKS